MPKFIPKNSEEEQSLHQAVTEIPSFAKFGNKFQEVLAQLILDDRAYADQIGEVLDPNFMESKALQVFVKLVYEYREKFKTHPSRDILASLIKSNSLCLSREPELTQTQVADFYARLIANNSNDGIEYVRATSLDFCRKQKIREAILKSVKLLKDASFDEISKLINDAMKLGSSNDLGTDYIIDFEKRYQITSRNPISTGWEEIDKIIQGGAGKGELNTVIALPGRGKSHILVHLGAEAIKQNKTVIHYTLELSEETIGKRYDAHLSGFELNNLSEMKPDVYDAIKATPIGRLLIKQYPTKYATTTTLRNHLDKCISHGIQPDMVIVDYGDLLKPQKNGYTEKRHDLESIFEELRAIAITYGVVVWTASQVGRKNSDESILSMESISEAYSKCFVADLIISMSRLLKDIPTKTGRFFVAKNRNGYDNLIYPIMIDTATSTIEVLPNETGETVEEIKSNNEKNVAKEQLKKLTELYNQQKKVR